MLLNDGLRLVSPAICEVCSVVGNTGSACFEDGVVLTGGAIASRPEGVEDTRPRAYAVSKVQLAVAWTQSSHGRFPSHLIFRLR